jgi:hypothetical protein
MTAALEWRSNEKVLESNFLTNKVIKSYGAVVHGALDRITAVHLLRYQARKGCGKGQLCCVGGLDTSEKRRAGT